MEKTQTIPDGYILDLATGKKVKDTSKEQVRQRMLRILQNEYGIALSDMETNFRVRVDGRLKKIDIAIFHSGAEHVEEHLSRVVVCRKEPSVGKKTVRIRDYEQAQKDIDDLEVIMSAIESCEYGLWTNGLEFFYLHKINTRFEIRFEPQGDWPLAGESNLSETPSTIRSRKADPEMLRISFRRCHNFIHGNEGMPKDAAFWQFLYLIFCKIHDETTRDKQNRLFWVGPREQFEPAGQKNIRKRITPLFDEVKEKYSNIFRGSEEITLSDRALSFMVSELAKFELSRTDIDAKGAAYQEIVGNNLRGDRGQYFTPRGAVALAVKMINPKEDERIIDPACGTGGFLVQTLAHLLDKFERDAKVNKATETTEQFLSVNHRLRAYAKVNLFGADFDPFLIKASQMNMVMAGDGHGHLYNINSLEYPKGHLADLETARREFSLADRKVELAFDVIVTNPPFGSDIPVTDRHILEQYELARQWEQTEDGQFRNKGTLQSSVTPEILFIERCIQLLKPGGRMGIVLPNGLLGSPGSEYIRWWILQKTWVLASVELPVEVFIVEANVNIQTSILFLKKKTHEEMIAENIGERSEYPIFMAVAENVGFDRRGNVLYKRHPNGEDIVEETEVEETVLTGQGPITRKITRRQKVVNDDLPEIAARYRQFVTDNMGTYSHLRDV